MLPTTVVHSSFKLSETDVKRIFTRLEYFYEFLEEIKKFNDVSWKQFQIYILSGPYVRQVFLKLLIVIHSHMIIIRFG